MAGGPLIPGLTEFDRPKGKRPAWIGWLIGSVFVVVALIVVAGFVGGVGPLRFLGTTIIEVKPVSYQGDPASTLLNVSIALPASGLCREDQVSLVAFERSNRVEIEASVSRPRSGQCTVTSLGGDVRWSEVELANPLGERRVIRTIDREPLPQA